MSDYGVGKETPETELGEIRRYRGPTAALIKFLGAAGCLFVLLEISGVFFYAGIFFLPQQYNAIFMAVVLTLTFLLVPAGKKAPRDKLP